MTSVEYTSPISKSAVVCDLVNAENESFWQYRENGKRMPCSTMNSQRAALEWFASVHKEFKPIFTFK